MAVLSASGETEGYLYFLPADKDGRTTIYATLDASDASGIADILRIYIGSQQDFDNLQFATPDRLVINLDSGGRVSAATAQTLLPGDGLIVFLDSGYVAEDHYLDPSAWSFSVWIDDLGTYPLVVLPDDDAGQWDDTDGRGRHYTLNGNLTMHHVDAELLDPTYGVMLLNSSAAFDAATRALTLNPGPLVGIDMHSRDVFLLTTLTSGITFPVAANYFPQNVLGHMAFSQRLAGQALTLTDMTIGEAGAAFGFVFEMPPELGGFLVEQSARSDATLMTRQGRIGDGVMEVADQQDVQLLGRLKATLQELEVTHHLSDDRLSMAPVVLLEDFILGGQDLKLHVTDGEGFVWRGGQARLDGDLSALGSVRILATTGPDPFRVTLEGFQLSLSDPTVLQFRTGLGLDLGFGLNTHFPVLEVRVGVTPDFTLDELVLEIPTIVPELPVIPPLLFINSFTAGLYGMAPGGPAPRMTVSAEFSVLPKIPAPKQLGGPLLEVVGLTVNGQLGLDGFQSTGLLRAGTILGGSAITGQVNFWIDAQDKRAGFATTGSLGLPFLGGGFFTGLNGSFGLDGVLEMGGFFTAKLAERLDLLLDKAFGITREPAISVRLAGHMLPGGTADDYYLEGGLTLQFPGFDSLLSVRAYIDGRLQFMGYNSISEPEFVEDVPAPRSLNPAPSLQRKGIENTVDGTDIVLRVEGEMGTHQPVLIDPAGLRRTAAEFEAAGGTIAQDEQGVSFIIADAARGRWMVETLASHGFAAAKATPGLRLSIAEAEYEGRPALQFDAVMSDRSEIDVPLRWEFFRDSDAQGFDGSVTLVIMQYGPSLLLPVEELNLPQGSWAIHARVSAPHLAAAEAYAPLNIVQNEFADRAVTSLRWVPLPAVDGVEQRYALAVTIAELGGVRASGYDAILRVGQQEFSLGTTAMTPGQTISLDLSASIGQDWARPVGMVDLVAEFTMLPGASDINAANNSATAVLLAAHGREVEHLAGGGGRVLMDGPGRAFSLDDGPWTIYAGHDHAIIEGGDGGNILMAGGRNNRIASGAGNDALAAGDAGGRVDAGGGDDQVWIGAAGGHVVDAGPGDDSIYGGGALDELIGGPGDDHFVLDGPARVIELRDGGIDTIWARGSGVQVPIHVEYGRLTGSATVLTGAEGAQALVANPTLSSSLLGGDGDDALWGQAGHDLLEGGQGDDTLRGGDGADTMAGGPGHDAYVVTSDGDVVLEEAEAGWDTVWVGVAAFTAPGNPGFAGYSVVEELRLFGAGRSLTGSEQAEILVANQQSGATLAGAGGDDVLWGSVLADVLEGGAGNDTIRSQGGADRIIFGPGWGHDDVVGFDAGARLDVAASGSMSLAEWSQALLLDGLLLRHGADSIMLWGRAVPITEADMIFA